MRRIRKVHIQTSEGFYDLINKERKKFQRQIGMSRAMPFPVFTEMLSRGKVNFSYPKLDVVGFKNVKRKKGRLY